MPRKKHSAGFRLCLPPGSTAEDLNAHNAAGFDLIEVRHFYTCQACGQVVDKRRLGDVLHHEERGHGPLLSLA